MGLRVYDLEGKEMGELDRFQWTAGPGVYLCRLIGIAAGATRVEEGTQIGVEGVYMPLVTTFGGKGYRIFEFPTSEKGGWVVMIYNAFPFIHIDRKAFNVERI
jgi:hypothetical protein